MGSHSRTLCDQHCPIWWRDLCSRRWLWLDPKIRKSRCTDSESSNDIHSPQSQQSDTRQWHRFVEASGSGGFERRRLSCVPAGSRCESRSWKAVHSYWIRLHGRVRPNSTASAWSWDSDRQWYRVHPQDQRGDGENFHFTSFQFLCWRNFRKWRMSGGFW